MGSSGLQMPKFGGETLRIVDLIIVRHFVSGVEHTRQIGADKFAVREVTSWDEEATSSR
jgi:hypothetical protein